MYRTVVASLTPFALAAAPLAQSLYTIDEGGQMIQQSAPAAGTCSLPPGPLLGEWSYATGGFCVAGVPLGSGFAGDMTMDRVNDVLWICDGAVIEERATFGSQQNALALGGFLTNPITGVAFDATTGWTWVTDGTDYTAFTPGPDISPTNPCSNGPLFQVGITPLPIAAGATATAMDYDAVTDTLVVCDDQGFVTRFSKAGAALNSFDAVGTSTCNLSAPLKAVAVDAAAPSGHLYVSDGAEVAYMNFGGSPVTSLYTPTSCFTPQGATLATPTPLAAMAMAATPMSFGNASFGIDPIIGVNGQSIVPNPNFQLVLAGLFGTLNTGDIAVLGVSNGSICPPITALGAPINIDLDVSIILSTTTLGDPAYVEHPAPIPGTLGIGGQLYFQWGVINPTTLVTLTTKGLAVTTSMP